LYCLNLSTLQFRTTLPPINSSLFIHHQNIILSLGSCFATNIGERLFEKKFEIQINPFGIIYNPVSINSGLVRLIENKTFSISDLVGHNGLWHSFDHHGEFSAPSADKVLETINGTFSKGRQKILKANFLLITLGTAFVFELKKTGEIVANCHKFPAQDFTRRCLSIDEIHASCSKAFQLILKENPNIQIITTVSPVRHIRDGLIENQKSKARLILALDQLCREFEQVHYFPAYELVMDDLRDYRFYKADMIHPNAMALDYVWEYFSNNYFSEETKSIIKAIEKINAALNHRPFLPESPAHQSFLQQTLSKIKTLESQYTFLNFSKEKEKINAQLHQ